MGENVFHVLCIVWMMLLFGTMFAIAVLIFMISRRWTAIFRSWDGLFRGERWIFAQVCRCIVSSVMENDESLTGCPPISIHLTHLHGFRIVLAYILHHNLLCSVITDLHDLPGLRVGFSYVDNVTLLRVFLCPRIEWSGAYCFCPVCLSVCLFVCLSVVNFNHRYNFWTVRGRDFIFAMYTPLMMPFQMTPRSMTLTLTFALTIAFLDFVAAGGIVSVSQTHLDFFGLFLEQEKFFAGPHG